MAQKFDAAATTEGLSVVSIPLDGHDSMDKTLVLWVIVKKVLIPKKSAFL